MTQGLDFMVGHPKIVLSYQGVPLTLSHLVQWAVVSGRKEQIPGHQALGLFLAGLDRQAQ